jgi:hypothetical protein
LILQSGSEPAGVYPPVLNLLIGVRTLQKKVSILFDEPEYHQEFVNM